jgi:hypothetical protein
MKIFGQDNFLCLLSLCFAHFNLGASDIISEGVVSVLKYGVIPLDLVEEILSIHLDPCEPTVLIRENYID